MATRPTKLEQQLSASLMDARAKRIRRTMTDSIVVHRDLSPVLDFTETQQQMIRDTFANGADAKEFQVLMEVAKLRRLNPLLKQIHFVKRWSKDLNRYTWSAQVSVDGLRAIAERTGKYDGQDEAEFGPMEKGFPEWARVKVYRKDWARPAVGTAYWSEYVQRTKEGGPTRFWKEMPRVMLAKCAEAIAMRKAFPEDMGGLYTDEEMQHAENGRSDGPVRIGEVLREHADELHLSPHAAPDEDQNADPKASDEFLDIMGTMGAADRSVFDPACEWHTVTRWREIIGSKGTPSALGKRLSALYHGNDISPSQRKEMGALWNRVDRKLTALETKLKPPPAEASFVDEPDGTEALGAERQPGEDDD